MTAEIDAARARHQAATLDQWLSFAPPPPERPENSHDTFISYRSADRDWAFALCDALALAGWRPFLDQFELVPGSSLQSSLEDALAASSSGVVLWSSKTKDSEWCKRERNAMRTLSDRDGGFRFMFVKLDEEELPPFAATELYLDFSGSPEGPRGHGLLSLVYGLVGEPPAQEATRVAHAIDQDTARCMSEIAAAASDERSDELVRIALSDRDGVFGSPGPVLQAAQELISMKKPELALRVLAYACAYFPTSLRVRQLEGLALRRLHRFEDAIRVLEQVRAQGHQDPETLGILAASWDGRYQESRKRLHLRRSRELYRTAFAADPTSYYAGINAASKSLFLDEPDEARQVAAEVLSLVEGPSSHGLWEICTLAEAYLLLGRVKQAANAYQRAIDSHPARAGDLGSTRRQAERICVAMALSTEEAEEIMAPFQLLDP